MVRLVPVWTKEEEESRKIYKISHTLKVREIETDRIMVVIVDILLERAIT